jgi:hypothetical protein
VALAIGRTLLGPLREHVAALVGGLEEHVFKRVLDFLHFPSVVVHGPLPYVAESSYHHPLYVRRLSHPFAILCDDVAAHATARLGAIERALENDVSALVALRATSRSIPSSLEPPGGLPALTEAGAPYTDIPMPVRLDMIDAGARLRAADPFADLSVGEATALRKLMSRREFAPGEAVVRQGEAGDALYVVEAGHAHVMVTDQRGQTRLARTVQAGDHFGEIALLGAGTRTANVVAATALTVLELRAEDYERYLAEGVAGVAARLTSARASRLAADEDR